ncbi:MAG: ABC transporter permease [Planctomycetota bacterium]
MPVTDFTFVSRSLSARTFSTITTILTVAVAVALLLVLLGMRDSGRKAFERGTGNMHLLLSRDASPLVSVLNGVYYAGAPRRPIDWASYQQIQQQYPWAWAIPTQIGDSFKGRPVLATTTEFFTAFEPSPGEPWQIAEGRFFETSFELVVGADAAKALGLTVGQRLSVTHGAPGPGGKLPEGAHVHDEFVYQIVGILKPTGSAHDRSLFSDLDSSWTLHAHDRRLVSEGPNIALTTPADLTDADRLITGIYCRLITRPGRDVTAVLQQVFEQLRADPTITVAQPSDEVRKLFAIVSNLDQIIIGIAFVVLAASGVSIMLALYNTMEQRRRQIAVLRVLGATRGKIFGLVMTESALIGIFGFVVGLVGSLIGATVVADLMYQRLGIVVDPSIDPKIAFGVALGTVALATIAGLVPAIVAYRVSVVRNLRPAA